MPIVGAQELNLTSDELRPINRIVQKKGYHGTFQKCNMPGCRNGSRRNNTTGDFELCPKCKGNGMWRKV
jgi:hypothetical protein